LSLELLIELLQFFLLAKDNHDRASSVPPHDPTVVVVPSSTLSSLGAFETGGLLAIEKAEHCRSVPVMRSRQCPPQVADY